MAPPPRGPRGGRASNRGRGAGRGGTSNGSRSQSSYHVSGNGSDAPTGPASSRGRGRGTAARGLAQVVQQTARQNGAAAGRGAKQASRGSRAPAGRSAPAPARNANETPEERFNRIREERVVERSNLEKRGLVSGEGPRRLDSAVTMVGTCQDMCAEFERARRIYQKDVWSQEMVTTTDDNGQTKRVVDESKMVKKFQRSAAGIDEQMPSDLRPPEVLLRTANYLFNEILEDDEALASANAFIWDRTRAIRNDFIIQQVKKTPDVKIAIECFEKITRYHILSLHQIGGKSELANDSYNWQQDREQLDKTLLSLTRYYENVRDRYQSPNEAEFRAYWILFQIGNMTATVEETVQLWPMELLKHPRIRRALDIYAAASDLLDPKGPLRPMIPLAIAQQNWQRFWNLVASKQTSYLMSCVAEIGFNIVRRIILTTICMAYYPGGKEVTVWTPEALTEVLGFDDEEQTRDFVEQSNMVFEQTNDSNEYLKLSAVRRINQLPEPTAEMPKQFHSWHLAERKRFGRTFSAVIAGMSFAEARQNDMILPDWVEDARMQSESDDGLFVKQDPPSKSQFPAQSDSTPAQPVSTAPAPFNPFTAGAKAAPFGTPSTAAPPFAAPPFAAPNTTASPFNAPATTSSTASPFSMPATSNSASGSGTSMFNAPPSQGSFGQLPKSFSFTTPPAQESKPSSTAPATTGAPAVPASTAFQVPPPATAQHNPFAAPVFQSSGTTPAPANPFASFTPKADAAPAAANPFASFAPKAAESAPIAQNNGGLFPAFSTSNSATPASTAPSAPTQNGPIASDAVAEKAIFSFTPPAPTQSATTQNQDKQRASETPSVSFSANSSFTPASSLSKPPNGILKNSSEQNSQPSFSFTPAVVKQSQAAAAPVSGSATSVPPGAQANKPSFMFPSTNGLTSAPPPAQPAPTLSAPSKASTVRFSLPEQSSASNSLLNSAIGTDYNAPSAISPRDKLRKEQGLDHIFERFVCDHEDGLISQYIRNAIGPVIRKEIEREKVRKLNQEADDFRTRTLTFRYGRRWARLYAMAKSRHYRAGLKKRAAESRKRKAEKEAEANKALRRSTLDEDLAAYRAEREAERKAAEKAEKERAQAVARTQERHGQQHVAHTSKTNSFDLIGQRHVEVSTDVTASTTLNIAGAKRGHQRSQTQPAIATAHTSQGRKPRTYYNGTPRDRTPGESTNSSISSFGRASSLLSGGSVLGLNVPYGQKVSSMQSPYFRLKAAGLGPRWPTDLSNSRGTKRSRLSGDDDLLTNGASLQSPAAKRIRSPADATSFSSPARPSEEVKHRTSFNSSTSSISNWKMSAKDEELLERARRVRDMLTEDEKWFKSEVEKEELRQSQELSRSRLGGSSLGGSPNGSVNGQDLSKLPKFYSRVSKFVPREEYGVRREKKQAEPEPVTAPRTNGTGSGSINGNKRQGGHQMLPPPAPPQQPTKAAGTSWDDAIEL